MYKKNEFKKLNSLYNTHLYTGLYGYAVRYCYRQLKNFKRLVLNHIFNSVAITIFLFFNYFRIKIS